MDDSRVGSPDRQTHLRHLEAFFSALATNGLAINLEKCVFLQPPLLRFLVTRFRRQERPHGQSRCRNQKLPAHSGYQRAVTFPLLSARQALNAWLETIPLALFFPIDPLKFRKAIFDHFHNIAHPGRLASRSIISSGLCGMDFPATSPPGPAGVWPASGARSTDTRLAPQPIPIP
jgi:hypothetical protein